MCSDFRRSWSTRRPLIFILNLYCNYSLTLCLSRRSDSLVSSQLVSSDSNLWIFASRTARSSSRFRIFIMLDSRRSVWRLADSVAALPLSLRFWILYKNMVMSLLMHNNNGGLPVGLVRNKHRFYSKYEKKQFTEIMTFGRK